MRVVHTSKNFKVLRNNRGYIVVKLNNTVYKEHGHFSKLYTAREFINIVERGELPTSKYYIDCAKRVLTTDEFNKLRHCSKGCKRYVNKSNNKRKQ